MSVSAQGVPFVEDELFEPGPGDAPAFIPSPVAEDAIHAFAGDPLSDVMRLVLLESPGKPVWGVELPDDDVRRALGSTIAR